MGHEVESEDVHDLLRSHEIELDAKKLQHLLRELQETLADDLSPEQDEVRESAPRSLI